MTGHRLRRQNHRYLIFLGHLGRWRMLSRKAWSWQCQRCGACVRLVSGRYFPDARATAQCAGTRDTPAAAIQAGENGDV